MSLLELCDTAYVLCVAQLERQYLADRQAFGVAALMNQESDAVPPSWDERQQAFDRLLLGEPDVDGDILAELGIAA